MKVQRVIAAILALLIIVYLGCRIKSDQPGRIDTVISILAYPFIQLSKRIAQPIKNIVHFRINQKGVQLELKRLRAEKKELLAQLIKIHSTILYADQTKELIQFSDRYNNDDLFLASILQVIKTPQEYSLLVHGGSYHGIEPDMVAVYKNCVVGRVHTVFPFYSRVVTVRDTRCIIPAITLASKSHGIYTGSDCYGTLDYVSHLEGLEPGELVVADGTGMIYPYGFGIGTIVSVNREGFHYNASIQPFIDPQELECCYLMKKGKSI